MKQSLQNAEQSEPIRIVRTETASGQNVAAQDSLTAEEMRRNVASALEQRRINERRARLRKRVFAGLTAALVVSLGLNAYFAAYLARRAVVVGEESRAAAAYRADSVAAPFGASSGVAEGEMRLVSLSKIKEGQTAYADLGTVANMAQSSSRVDPLVSANRPYSNVSGPLHGLWEIVPRDGGYVIAAYARPGDALRAANGGGATLYSEAREGLARIEIPARRFSGAERKSLWENNEYREFVELAPNR